VPSKPKPNKGFKRKNTGCCSHTVQHFNQLYFSASASDELSRCAEPNADSIECIYLIESVRLKKDVMEHHNDKGISMEHIQITQYKQLKTALQPRASIKKSKFL
jgi:hypothetical protein